jgi:hypothetical protein
VCWNSSTTFSTHSPPLICALSAGCPGSFLQTVTLITNRRQKVADNTRYRYLVNVHRVCTGRISRRASDTSAKREMVGGTISWLKESRVLRHNRSARGKLLADPKLPWQQVTLFLFMMSMKRESPLYALLPACSTIATGELRFRIPIARVSIKLPDTVIWEN